MSHNDRTTIGDVLDALPTAECAWKQYSDQGGMGDDMWDTDCGECFCFIDSAPPSEHKYWFCPHCGRPIREELASYVCLECGDDCEPGDHYCRKCAAK